MINIKPHVPQSLLKKITRERNSRRLVVAFLVAISGCAESPIEKSSESEGSNVKAILATISRINTARDNFDRKAWAKNLIGRYESQVEWVLRIKWDSLVEFINQETPWSEFGQACPNCVGVLSTEGEADIYKWIPDNPNVLECKYCKQKYPSEKYLENKNFKCKDSGQEFSFYLNKEEEAHPENTSGEYAYKWGGFPCNVSWTGLIRFYKINAVINAIYPMAIIGVVKKEKRHIDAAKALLIEIAKKYKSWLYHSACGVFIDLPPEEVANSMSVYPIGGRFSEDKVYANYKYRTSAPIIINGNETYGRLPYGFLTAGRFRTDGREGKALLELLLAYDLISSTSNFNELEGFSAEEEFHIWSFFDAAFKDHWGWNNYGNKGIYSQSFVAAYLKYKQDAKGMADAIDNFKSRFISSYFHEDGFCKESPSYGDTFLQPALKLMEIFDNANVLTEKNKPTFKSYLEIKEFQQILKSLFDCVIIENSRYLPIGDTVYNHRFDPELLEAYIIKYEPSLEFKRLLEERVKQNIDNYGTDYSLWNRGEINFNNNINDKSAVFPYYKVAKLKPGPSHLLVVNGSERSIDNNTINHRHKDTLSILNYYNGVELLSDRGYIWDDARNAWTSSTLSHNTVTVDRCNQKSGQIQGAPATTSCDYYMNSAGVCAIRLNGSAYEQCTRYSRTLVSVFDNNIEYAIDIFNVSGGFSHQYSINCCGVLSSTKGINLTSSASTIEWLSNLRESINNVYPAEFIYSVESVKLKIFLCSPVNKIFVADAPGWREASGTSINVPPIQQIICENNGNNLMSLFCTIIAPYSKENCPIASVSYEIINGDTQSVMLSIKYQDGEAAIVYLSNSQNQNRIENSIFSGNLIFISIGKNNEVKKVVGALSTQLWYKEKMYDFSPPYVTADILNTIGNKALFVDMIEPVKFEEIGAVRYSGMVQRLSDINSNSILAKYPMVYAPQYELIMQKSLLGQ